MRRAALLLASLLVAGTAAELIARRLLPAEPYRAIPDEPSTGGLYVEHPTRQIALRPGFRGRVEHQDFHGERVEIDGRGFRNPERALLDEDRRIVVLGDSMAFGLGVEQGGTFAALLERQLPGISVTNTGVPGYGTVHELRVLEEIPPARLAIVAFYTGNDLEDNVLLLRDESFHDLLARVPEEAVKKGRLEVTTVVNAGRAARVLFAHPPSALRFPLPALPPGSELQVGLALTPEARLKPTDGVEFTVTLEAAGAGRVLFRRLVDRARTGVEALRLELPSGEGQTLVFETGPGTRGDTSYDWAVWVEPRLRLPAGLDPAFEGLDLDAVAEAASSGRRPVGPPPSDPISRSRFLSFVRSRLPLFGHGAVTNTFLVDSLLREPPPAVETALEVTRRALLAIAERQRSHGGGVLLALIPARVQTEPPSLRRFLEAAGLPPSAYEAASPHRALTEIARQLRIPVVDLLPVLTATEGAYFAEGHLDRPGHRVVAGRLAAPVHELLRGKPASAPPNAR